MLFYFYLLFYNNFVSWVQYMDNYNFGVEIEFGDSNLYDVYELCMKYNLPVRYCLNHKFF